MFTNNAGIVFVSSLVVLTVGASVPPNLDITLEAQRGLVAERPYDAQVHNDLGNLLILDGKKDEAEAAYRRAIELAPEETLARFNLGVLLQQDGRWRDALTELKGVLDVEPHHARALYQIGTLYEARRQRGRALDYYAKAFAYDTDLTFADKNPHLIDNQLATEAMLMSARFAKRSSSETARLYSEPERIADLMLRSDVPQLPDPAEAAWESSPGEQQATQRHSEPSLDEDEEDDDGEAYDNEEDEEGESSGRRTLTAEDLEVGSNLGRAQRIGGAPVSSRRRRPAIGTGRAGAASSQRQDATRDGRQQATPPPRRRTTLPSSPSSRSNAVGRPRYIPSGASTGRLELELLPLQVEPAERLAAGASAPAQTLNRM